MVNKSLTISNIQSLIYTIRNTQVMLDRDLAILYSVEIRRLNEQVKRNKNRFPQKFMFQLSQTEYDSLRSQNATLKTKSNQSTESLRGRHRKYLPYVFSEQGVAMLSAVLRSETAIRVSIQIMNAFVQMRKFILENGQLLQRIGKIEKNQIETDQKIEQVFKAIEAREIIPKKRIFFDGQVYDAYILCTKIIRSANTSIALIDNYIDESVLTLFTKRRKDVKATIYTRSISKQLKLDIEKHNQQYPEIIVKEIKNVHDRFLIIDEKTLYHIGASIKDLGKKWFAFSKMDIGISDIINRIKNC